MHVCVCVCVCVCVRACVCVRQCNSGPKKVFEPQREQVTGSWREVRNEELHEL
jgi:hypothetical protein